MRILICISSLVILCTSLFAVTSKPNILLMMADDLGWMDLSSFGNTLIETPNIDRLASTGMIFNRFYAASAVCTPTRVSVLTGNYPIRYNIRRQFRDRGEFLPKTQTLPMLLSENGYNTAHVGKWHLGGARIQDTFMRNKVFGPHEHGFHTYLLQREEQPLRRRMHDMKRIYRDGGTALLMNDNVVTESHPYFNMYLTDIYAEETRRLIRKYSKDDSPFFINLWWLAPHTPYEPAPEPHWSLTACDSITEDQHRFRSMVARMDFQVGRIFDLLDELDLINNTIVIFLSDNGGAYESNIGNLKGGKTDLHEGGILVPALMSWPGRISEGRKSDNLVHTNDLLPTIMGLIGLNDKYDEVDGIDISEYLIEKSNFPKRGLLYWQLDLFTEFQRHEPKPTPYATEVVRDGEWKLLALDGLPVALYNIHNDLYEQINLLHTYPERVQLMHKKLTDWLDQPRLEIGYVP